MTDREKLVGLIVEIENEMIKAYPYTTDQFRIEKTVDHLLANGVTVHPEAQKLVCSISIDCEDVWRMVFEEFEYGGKTLAEWTELLKNYERQQWISVEERLPEKYVDVLGKSGKLIWVVSFDGMQWEDNYGYYHKIEEFPCWMPLPETPKEEE